MKLRFRVRLELRGSAASAVRSCRFEAREFSDLMPLMGGSSSGAGRLELLARAAEVWV